MGLCPAAGCLHAFWIHNQLANGYMLHYFLSWRNIATLSHPPLTTNLASLSAWRQEWCQSGMDKPLTVPVALGPKNENTIDSGLILVQVRRRTLLEWYTKTSDARRNMIPWAHIGTSSSLMRSCSNNSDTNCFGVFFIRHVNDCDDRLRMKAWECCTHLWLPPTLMFRFELILGVVKACETWLDCACQYKSHNEFFHQPMIDFWFSYHSLTRLAKYALSAF